MSFRFSDESFIDDKSTRRENKFSLFKIPFTFLNIFIFIKKILFTEKFYSSYSKYSLKLKEIGLETRIVDLDQIYQIGFQQLQELRDFLNSNSDLIKTLLEAFEKVSLCLEIDLLNALDGHKKISEELWQTLNGIENSFFYEDLIDYFETLKKVKFNELRHNKIYNTADTFYIDKKFDLKKLKLALIDEDDVKFQFEEIVEDYLDEMTANVENKRSLENIQKLSGKFVEICKEKMKQMVVALKEYGLLDKEKLLNSTEEMKNVENLCQNVVRDLESDVSRLESSVLADVGLVDRFSRANIFLVDKDGGKFIEQF